MDKIKCDKITNALFIIAVGLTFFNLYNNIVWLSCFLTAIFFALVLVHIRDYKKENPKSKKKFIFMLIILINFLLANSIIIISEFVYPY